MVGINNLGYVKMLSVEDDDFNQELATALFEEFSNIEIFKAKDGEEAINILERESIDIVLLDLLMPKVDGIETLKYIKGSDELKDIPVIIVTSKESEKKETYKLGADDFISKPYNPEELKLRVFNHLKLRKFYHLFANLENIRLRDGVNSKNYRDSLKEIVELAESSQKKLLVKLGKLAHGTQGLDTKGSIRVGQYAKLLAYLYGLRSKDVENLYYSMFIYDIGMLRVIGNSMDSREYKLHPSYGAELLEDMKETPLIKLAKDVTLYHHENFDGSGFPKGLEGEEIPIYARIASIADKFDELTSVRRFSREKVKSTEAKEYIKRDSGSIFDPELVEIFIKHFHKFKDIKNKYIDED